MEFLKCIGRSIVTIATSTLIGGLVVWIFAFGGCNCGSRWSGQMTDDFYYDYQEHYPSSGGNSWKGGWFIVGMVLGFAGGVSIVVNTRGETYF